MLLLLVQYFSLGQIGYFDAFVEQGPNSGHQPLWVIVMSSHFARPRTTVDRASDQPRSSSDRLKAERSSFNSLHQTTADDIDCC